MKERVKSSDRRAFLRDIGFSTATFVAASWSGIASSVSEEISKKPIVITKSRLDALSAEFYDVFNQSKVLPPFTQGKHAAHFDIELRRIKTFTRVPETGERVKISGILAMPVGAKGRLPVVSWQHGTTLSFDQVPSNLMRLGESGYTLQDNVDSIETLFNLHRLAGQGFCVIAADYLGKGPFRDGRGEAYAVKNATVQTCVDILNAGLAIMRDFGVSRSALFLNGWSQGGLNTLWLKQELQRRRIKVAAVCAQSPFNNLADTFRLWCGALNFASPGDPPYPPMPRWVCACIIVLLGSYREYYRLNDLFQTAIRPEYQNFAENYWRSYPQGEDVLLRMPTPRALLVDGFLDRFTANSNSQFLRHLASNSATFWDYDTPTRLYYGLADEALHPNLVTMALASDGVNVQGAPVSGANHRATFLASLYGEGSIIAGKTTVPEFFRSVL